MALSRFTYPLDEVVLLCCVIREITFSTRLFKFLLPFYFTFTLCYVHYPFMCYLFVIFLHLITFLNKKYIKQFMDCEFQLNLWIHFFCLIFQTRLFMIWLLVRIIFIFLGDIVVIDLLLSIINQIPYSLCFIIKLLFQEGPLRAWKLKFLVKLPNTLYWIGYTTLVPIWLHCCCKVWCIIKIKK